MRSRCKISDYDSTQHHTHSPTSLSLFPFPSFSFPCLSPTHSPLLHCPVQDVVVVACKDMHRTLLDSKQRFAFAKLCGMCATAAALLSISLPLIVIAALAFVMSACLCLFVCCCVCWCVAVVNRMATGIINEINAAGHEF